MNCREAQQQLYASPFTDEPGVRGHTTLCEACRRVAADLVRLECEIRDSAMAVPVPEGLAARVLLRERSSLGRPLRSTLQRLLQSLRIQSRRKTNLPR
jgi:hypothetical protein